MFHLTHSPKSVFSLRVKALNGAVATNIDQSGVAFHCAANCQHICSIRKLQVDRIFEAIYRTSHNAHQNMCHTQFVRTHIFVKQVSVLFHIICEQVGLCPHKEHIPRLLRVQCHLTINNCCSQRCHLLSDIEQAHLTSTPTSDLTLETSPTQTIARVSSQMGAVNKDLKVHIIKLHILTGYN